MVATSPELEMFVRVEHAAKIADHIYLFDLRHPEGETLPAFTAGSHITVRVPNGLLRKYSLCNDPAEQYRYEIAVKREATGRGGSVSLVDEIKTGDRLLVSFPRNNFALTSNAASYIFIAGGIGITPIMSMIRYLQANGRNQFKLYYCVSTPEQAAFRKELSVPEFPNVKIHYDQGNPAHALDFWPILERSKGRHLWCCGPDSMMRVVRDMTGHWPSGSVHFESFAESSRNTMADRPFAVRLARSGEVIDIPVGMTILQALRAKGHQVPSSCESGTCGACRTRLLAGEVDHRDLVLLEDEKASNVMICVSRARSQVLVIDR
jgi:phthalate 4,5-dioxygenase reductase component